MKKKSPYSSVGTRARTPQTQPIRGREPDMVKNDAGGYVFKADDFVFLRRFLIIGSEGGTYYTNEKDHTIRSYECLVRCLESDYTRAIDLIEKVSIEGLAPKQDATIFSLAVAATYKTDSKQRRYVDVRRYALRKVNTVCRTGTHLLMFAGFIKARGAPGRAVRWAISQWYNAKTDEQLAYQLAKYQNREGWSHRDVLRIAHVKPEGEGKDLLFKWVMGKECDTSKLPGMALALEDLKVNKDVWGVIEKIIKYKAIREIIPTEYRNDPFVWQAMLEHDAVPLDATIRNLGNMSSYGVFADKKYVDMTVARMLDSGYVHKSRMHPLSALIAKFTYDLGEGVLGSNRWTSIKSISDALEKLFYLAFKNARPTNKRILVAIDCSGSMRTTFGNIAGFTSTHAAVALALSILNSEPDGNVDVVTFTTGIRELNPFTKSSSIEDAMRRVDSVPEGTDCSVPIDWAITYNKNYDAIIEITDTNTWAGPSHVSQALARYRQRCNRNCKLISIVTEASGNELGDPKDPNSISIAGFDASTPQIISSFITD